MRATIAKPDLMAFVLDGDLRNRRVIRRSSSVSVSSIPSTAEDDRDEDVKVSQVERIEASRMRREHVRSAFGHQFLSSARVLLDVRSFV